MSQLQQTLNIIISLEQAKMIKDALKVKMAITAKTDELALLHGCFETLIQTLNDNTSGCIQNYEVYSLVD